MPLKLELSLSAFERLPRLPLLQLGMSLLRLRPEGVVSVHHTVPGAVALDLRNAAIPGRRLLWVAWPVAKLPRDVVGRRDPGGGRGQPRPLRQHMLGDCRLRPGFMADLGELCLLGLQLLDPLAGRLPTRCEEALLVTSVGRSPLDPLKGISLPPQPFLDASMSARVVKLGPGLRAELAHPGDKLIGREFCELRAQRLVVR